MELITLIPRAGMLRPPRRRLRSAKPSRGVVVHCTGGKHPSTEKQARAYWAASQAWHMGEVNGWPDIGYSFGFNDLGIILEGRGWYSECAAGPPHNRDARHFCYQGDGLDPTPEAIDALAWLIDQHDRIFGRGFVVGHRDFARKSCPGDGVYAALLELWGDRNLYRKV